MQDSFHTPMPNQDYVMPVSELNRLVREVLEQSIPLCWVSGEISNFTRAASGHWYFSLKDSGTQVRCVMFKHKAVYVDWTPREGDKIEARALVSLYEARGDYQLTVEFIRKSGLGSLFEAYEALKQQLQKEGLFDAHQKKSIPTHPRCIGIVTSPDAAALRDILTTLKRRMPSIPIIIYPTPVQGKTAATTIAKAIERANQHAQCDVLLVARGGGSIEDLWSFNEEMVARAVFASRIPIVSGVGHETDFTITDFVADARAATPTAAAEMVSPDLGILLQQLSHKKAQLARLTRQTMQTRMQQLDYLSRRLISPHQQLQEKQKSLNQLQQRLALSMQAGLKQQYIRLNHLIDSLRHLNPKDVLGRGYAIVRLQQNQHIVTHAAEAKHGQAILIQWADGEKEAVITPANVNSTQKSLF